MVKPPPQTPGVWGVANLLLALKGFQLLLVTSVFFYVKYFVTKSNKLPGGKF